VSFLQLDVSAAPEKLLEQAEPTIGDIYKKAGGTAGFWLVYRVNPMRCAVMAFDLDGVFTGTSEYGTHYFRDHPGRRVGRAEIPRVTVIEWFPQ